MYNENTVYTPRKRLLVKQRKVFCLKKRILARAPTQPVCTTWQCLQKIACGNFGFFSESVYIKKNVKKNWFLHGSRNHVFHILLLISTEQNKPKKFLHMLLQTSINRTDIQNIREK